MTTPQKKQFNFAFGAQKPLPDRLMLYGPPGVGKSTFASRFPNPFFLDPESGAKKIVPDEDRYSDFDPLDDAGNWERTLAFLEWFGTADHKYKTIVLDTADKLLGYAGSWVCQNVGIVDRDTKKTIPVNSLDKVAGGYGRGSEALVEQTRLLIGRLEYIGRQRQIAVIALSHEHLSSNGGTGGEEYKTWSPNLDKKVVEVFLREFDYVLQAQPHVVVSEKSGGFGTKKTVTGQSDKRYLWCKPQGDRKIKARTPLPVRIDFNYESFVDAMKNAGDAEFVARGVAAKIAQVDKPKVREQMERALVACGKDIGAICELETRIDDYLTKSAAEAQAGAPVDQAS